MTIGGEKDGGVKLFVFANIKNHPPILYISNNQRNKKFDRQTFSLVCNLYLV